jgi:hypothetical protein
VTDIPFDTLLAPGGDARRALASQWGQWADVFCDALLIKLAQDHVEDLVLQYGAHFVTFGTHSGGVMFNVRWTSDEGFTTYYGETVAAALGNLWIARAAYFKAKETPNGTKPDPGHAGHSDQVEILPWTG